MLIEGTSISYPGALIYRVWGDSAQEALLRRLMSWAERSACCWEGSAETGAHAHRPYKQNSRSGMPQCLRVKVGLRACDALHGTSPLGRRIRPSAPPRALCPRPSIERLSLSVLSSPSLLLEAPQSILSDGVKFKIFISSWRPVVYHIFSHCEVT